MMLKATDRVLNCLTHLHFFLWWVSLASQCTPLNSYSLRLVACSSVGICNLEGAALCNLSSLNRLPWQSLNEDSSQYVWKSVSRSRILPHPVSHAKWTSFPLLVAFPISSVTKNHRPQTLWHEQARFLCAAVGLKWCCTSHTSHRTLYDSFVFFIGYHPDA